MKQITIALGILVIQIFAHAGGDLVNNGGGLSEKTILFAYKNLAKHINLCIQADGCKISEKQRQLLQRIVDQLPNEYQNLNQIEFISEKSAPGTFIIDGEVKVAKTGSSVGSPILINTDLIYHKNEVGVYVPTSLAEATAILIHELGHHHGDWSHEELDLLGVKVSLLLNQKIYTSPFLPWSQDIQLTVINYDINHSFPDVILGIGDDLIDLSADYKKSIRCPRLTIPVPILPLPDITLPGKKPNGSMLHNLHWVKFRPGKDGQSTELQLEGNITQKCADKKLFLLNTNHKMSLKIEVQKENKVWKLVPESISLKQHANSWWKLIRLPN